jgi:type VI protein secretion system component VasK
MSTNLVQSAVQVARSRLIRQAFLNRVSVALAIGVGVALVWFFLQPLLMESAPGWLRWTVLGTCTLLALGYTLWQTRRHAPSPQDAALEVDGAADGTTQQ